MTLASLYNFADDHTNVLPQSAFTRSHLTIETLEQGMKYVQG